MHVTKRNLWTMGLLLFFTLGIYAIYWLVVTKNEFNNLGTKLPTAWLIIIPFANIYFLYRFAQSFSEIVLRDKSQSVPYFLLLILIFPISELIFQHEINEVIF